MADKKKPEISIIMPVKNEEKNIIKCLSIILDQKIDIPFEFIIIDSGSTDHTLEILKDFKADNLNIKEIRPEDFGHGKTRNLGLEYAQGNYLVFLNGDALPFNQNWLKSMYDNFNQIENLAAVYSRHLPKEGCYLYMKRDIEGSFPAIKKTFYKAEKFKQMVFSTVSCMIKRSIFEKILFQNDIVIAEDQDWARKILNKTGKGIAYEPQSMVYHSHNYSSDQLFKIKRQVGAARNPFSNKISLITVGSFLIFFGCLFKILMDIKYILLSKNNSLNDKFKEIMRAFGARFNSFWGKYQGWWSVK